MIHDLDVIKDKVLRDLVAKTVLAYHARSVTYDAVRDRFTVEGLNGGPDKQLVRDAVISLGAAETDRPDGKLIVHSENGARNVALRLKELGVDFKGAGDLPSQGILR